MPINATKVELQTANSPDAGGTLIDGGKKSEDEHNSLKLKQIMKENNLKNDRRHDVLNTPCIRDFLQVHHLPDSAFYCGSGPHLVYTYVEINNMSDVKTTENTFQLDVKTRLSWKPSRKEVDALLNDDLSMFDIGSLKKTDHMQDIISYRPKVQAYNAKSVSWDSGWIKFQLVYDIDKGLLLTHERQIIAELSEMYELHNFPLDVQDCCLTLCSIPVTPQTDTTVMRLLPDKPASVAFRISDLQDWNMLDKCFIEFNETDPAGSNSGESKWDIVKVRLKIYRRYEHYLYRLCLILSLVTLCSNLGFTMDFEDDFPDICAFLSTCLLTIIAFMFVVTSTLPAIPYLTFIDSFLISLLGYALLQMVVLGFVSQDVDVKPNTVLIASLVGWLAIHIGFIIAGCCKRNREMKKLYMNGTELQKNGLESAAKWIADSNYTSEEKKKFVIDNHGEKYGCF